MKELKWYWKALVLGGTFFVAALIVQPVGVSTQYSVLAGIVHNLVEPSVITVDEDRDSGYRSSNAYYDKNEGKIAKEIKELWNYGFVFVLAIPLGACAGYFVSKAMGERNRQKENHTDRRPAEQMGCNANAAQKSGFVRRYFPPFIGGFLLLYGARMADGCTSGHMMSGMMQGSVSGYLFAAAVFAVAIPVAIIIGNRKSKY